MAPFAGLGPGLRALPAGAALVAGFLEAFRVRLGFGLWGR